MFICFLFRLTEKKNTYKRISHYNEHTFILFMCKQRSLIKKKEEKIIIFKKQPMKIDGVNKT